MELLNSQARRGLIAVQANASTGEFASMISQLNAGFEAFKKRQDDRITDLESALDEISAAVAAARVGPAGAPPHRRDPEQVAALSTYLRRGDDTAIKAAMTGGSDPDGGYAVPPFLSDEVTMTLKSTTAMRRVARIETIDSGGSFEEIVDTSEPAADWVGERDTRPETAQGQMNVMDVPTHEMYASPKATQALIDDSRIDIAGWLAQRIADKFTRLENTAFVTGDGVKRPRGFLAYTTEATADATRAWGRLEHVVTGDAVGFAASNPSDVFFDLQAALKDEYLAPVDPADPFSGAVWMMNRRTKSVVRKFKDGQNNYLWAAGNIAAGQPETLMGYPIVTGDDLPDLGANALPVAFGNFRRGYLIVDRVGVRVLRDPYTDRPYIVFYTTKRVGGAVQNFEAIKLLKVST